MSNRDGRRRQRGASLVELSLVLFILLLLLAGVIDFGRVFNSYIVVTNASREGARYASREVPRTDIDDLQAALIRFKEGIEDAVKQETVGSSVDPEELEIRVDPDPAPDDGTEGTIPDPGDPITVAVGYEVPTIIADIAGFGYLPLGARTTMIVFGSE